MYKSSAEIRAAISKISDEIALLEIRKRALRLELRSKVEEEAATIHSKEEETEKRQLVRDKLLKEG